MNRFLKFLIGAVAAIALLIVIIIAALPTIVNTLGKESAMRQINKEIPGSVSFNSFSVGWLSGITIDDFQLVDPQGNPVITFKHLEADISPLDLMMKNLKWGSLKLSDLNATVEMTSSGLTNLQESLGQKPFPAAFQLKSPVSLTGVTLSAEFLANEIRVGTSGKTIQGGVAGSFDIDSRIHGKQINLTGDVEHFPVAILDSFVALSDPELGGLLTELVGDSISINIDQKQDREKLTFQFEANSPHLLATFKGRVVNGIISLDQPGKLSLDTSTSKLKNWNIKQFQGLKFQIEKMEIPVDFFSPGWNSAVPEKIALISDFSLEKLQYQTQDTDLSLVNLKGKLESLKDVRDFTVDAEGLFEKERTPIKFQFDSRFQKPSHINALAQKLNQFTDFHVSVQDLPTKTLDGSLDTDEYFYHSLGERVSLDLRGSSQDYGVLYLQLDSNKIAIPKMRIQVDDVYSPNGDLTKMDVSGRFEIEQILFRDESPDTTLTNLDIPWQYSGSRNQLHANLTGSSEKGGAFSGKLALNDWNSPQGTSIEFNLKGDNIPAHFFHFVTGKPFFAATFGSLINTDIYLSIDGMHGAAQLRLKGSEGYATLKGKITDGILTLKEPLYLETTASKKLGSEVFSEFAPPLSSVVSGNTPITVKIDPKGFSMPLLNFDISQIEIPNGTLQLGKLNFNNQGDIKKIARFLNIPKSENVSVWFTPQYFRMHKGVVQLERMDFLINDSNPLATWGKVDFLSDRINVRIGISGIALANAFKLQNIERDLMLQVPLKGPIKDAKVDLSSVTAQIGSYLAKSGGTAHGMLLGSMLDIANGSNGKVPPPTTKPLPWQKLLERQQVTREQGTEKPEKVKTLEKEAKQLLKGLFD